MLYLAVSTVEILENPSGVSAFAPNAVSVRCSASCFSACNTTWIRTVINGSETGYSLVTDSALVSTTEQTDGERLIVTCTLTIEPTSTLDTGNYSCRVMLNSFETTSRQAEVVIYGKISDLRLV